MERIGNERREYNRRRSGMIRSDDEEEDEDDRENNEEKNKRNEDEEQYQDYNSIGQDDNDEEDERVEMIEKGDGRTAYGGKGKRGTYGGTKKETKKDLEKMMDKVYDDYRGGIYLSAETKKVILNQLKKRVLPKMKFVRNEHLFGRKGSIVKELKGTFGQFWRLNVTANPGLGADIFRNERTVGGIEMTVENKCRLWMSIREDVLHMIRKHRSEAACEMKKVVTPGKKIIL